MDGEVARGMLFASTVVSLGLGIYGLRRRPRPGATAFAAFTFGSAIWAGGSLGASLSQTVAASVLWTRVMYLGVTFVPVAWFVVAARYTNSDGLLSRRRVAALVAFASVVLLAMWTNDLHGLFYESIYASEAALTGFDVVHGPLFYAWLAVGYALLLGGCGLLVRMLYHRKRIYRRQAAVTLVTVLAPIAANVAYLAEATTSDWTPFAFAVSGLALGWAMHRYQFMSVTPVAREMVVEHIHDGVLVVDDDDKVVDANAAARTLLGIPDDATVVGRRGAAVLESPFDTLFDRFADVEQGSNLLTFETDGEQLFYDVDVRPFEDHRGRERGRLFYLHDVTERERRERELQRKNEQLDRFAHLVSHDLRNPLSVAEGYVEYVSDTGEVEKLDNVSRAHERMRAIIDDVLELAQDGNEVTDPEPVVVADVAVAAWRNVDTAEASLDCRTTATILADQSRLEQLFENLFRNAVQHGGEAVTVTVEETPDGFSVSDDGSGIGDAEREEVLSDGYTTHREGTGLGLTIVKRVADAHDWTIEVGESEDGGARFTFTGTTIAQLDAVSTKVE